MPTELALVQVAVGGLAVVLVALTLLACWYATSEIFRAFANHLLAHVPLIGGALARAVDGAIISVQNAVASWLRPHLKTIVDWLEALIDRMQNFPDAVADFALRVDAAIDHLVKTKIAEVVHTVVDPLETILTHLRTRVGTIADDLDTLTTGLPTRFAAVREWAHDNILVPLRGDLHEFRVYVDGAVVPSLKQLIGATRTELETGIATVAHEADATRDALRAEAQRIDVPVHLLEGLIAAVGIQAAAEAIDTLARCSPKMRQICTTNPSVWSNFIAGLGLLAFWPGLLELTREAQGILREHRGAVHDLIVNGG